jgi:hypothetical protein
VSGLGDLNGDGYVEVITGAYGDSINGYRSGHIKVTSAKKLLDPDSGGYRDEDVADDDDYGLIGDIGDVGMEIPQ